MDGGEFLTDNIYVIFFSFTLGKPQKKVFFLVDGPLRGGGGLNGCATKEKSNFFLM